MFRPEITLCRDGDRVDRFIACFVVNNRSCRLPIRFKRLAIGKRTVAAELKEIARTEAWKMYLRLINEDIWAAKVVRSALCTVSRRRCTIEITAFTRGRMSWRYQCDERASQTGINFKCLTSYLEMYDEDGLTTCGLDRIARATQRHMVQHDISKKLPRQAIKLFLHRLPLTS